LWVGTWVAVVVAYGLLAPIYYQGLGATVGILALLGMGMVLVTGFAGQFSLAVGAFYGIGAYMSTIMTVNFGWYGLLALAAGAFIAGAIGFAVARPIFRLRGHFLAMGTLAMTEVFYMAVNNSTYTGGSSGIGGIKSLNVFGLVLSSTSAHFVLNWMILGVVLWAIIMMQHSREGRALKAIRGHEAAAASAGIDIPASKSRVFVIAAVLSSVGGSLYAHQMLYVNPPPFGLGAAITVLMIAVLGGMRSPWGAVIGATLYELLRQLTEVVLPVLVGSAGVGAGQQLLIAFLLVVILIRRPAGAAGLFTYLWKKYVKKSDGESTTTESIMIVNADETADMFSLRALEDRTMPDKTYGDVLLETYGVSKHFGGVVALDDVHLAIRQGEILAVIGPNGAGKSTLVNVISGNLKPTAGTFAIMGEDAVNLKAHQIARLGLSRTFQTPSLFEEMSVEDTIKVGAHTLGAVGLVRGSVPTPKALAEEREFHKRAVEIMEQVGLADFASRDAKTLSLGQQKIVEIARAMIRDPRILLLDEPCAGLNKFEKKKLMLLLRELSRGGLAILVIEHDMEFVMATADRVHVLNFGTTLKEGTPAEVRADREVIDAYLGAGSAQTTSATSEVEGGASS
jgi:branched-chain amino acid transport system permease protein